MDGLVGGKAVYIDNGIAKKIGKDELMRLLDAVEKEGLVVCTSFPRPR